MVDLPGYGFAKANAKNRLEWFGFTSEYFLERKSLIMVMLLVDASIPPQQSDVECLQWMADREVRVVSLTASPTDHRRRRPTRHGFDIPGRLTYFTHTLSERKYAPHTLRIIHAYQQPQPPWQSADSCFLFVVTLTQRWTRNMV